MATVPEGTRKHDDDAMDASIVSQKTLLKKKEKSKKVLLVCLFVFLSIFGGRLILPPAMQLPSRVASLFVLNHSVTTQPICS